MPERASIFTGVQVGVETTPGTAVAANRRLNSISIEPAPNPEFNSFRPLGQKFRSMVVMSREWTAAGISGLASYSELPFLLDCLLMKTTPTGPVGTIYTRVWTPAARAADTVSTLTIEQGSAERAHRMVYGMVTGLEITFSRTGDGVDVSGDIMARALEDNFTLTASPTALPLDPILPKDISVYSDPTSATLGTTKLLRVLSATWRLTDRFSALWALDAAQPSFVAAVETEPTAQVELLVEADAQGMAFLADARAGTTRFIRIIATGANGREARFDVAGQVSAVGEFSDEDGVFALSFTFDAILDPTWNKAMEVRVLNAQATL